MDRDKIFEMEVDGAPVTARKGQTIAEALLASGRRVLRKTKQHAPRGVYCGIGICYECRMVVNGIPNVRTCMAQAAPGLNIVTQDDAKMKGEN